MTLAQEGFTTALVMTVREGNGKLIHPTIGGENFSSSPVAYTLPNGLKAANLRLSDIPGSHDANVSTLELAPWESRIYKQ